MKIKELTLGLSLIVMSNVVHSATNNEYNSYMKKISNLESQLAKCIPDEDRSYLCYPQTENSYNKIITEIRSKYSNKVDQKLWLSISSAFNKVNKLCADPYFESGKAYIYYPYLDCKNSALHGLAVTTVELHLK